MINTIDINVVKNIALQASKIIMEIYKKDFQVEYKDDKSPITEADLKANKVICENLKKHYPDIPIISEENIEIPYEIRKKWQYYWCIDPIDGTKEFVKKNGEFTVNIALIHNSNPVCGVVVRPTTNDVYYAKKGYGAFKNNEKLPLKQINKNEYLIAVSRSHINKTTKSYINSLVTSKPKKLVSIGSSLKICLVAEGVMDIYPRFAPTKEWDTAAAHAIAIESGKNIYQTNSNKQLVYNKSNLVNPHFIVK